MKKNYNLAIPFLVVGLSGCANAYPDSASENVGGKLKSMGENVGIIEEQIADLNRKKNEGQFQTSKLDQKIAALQKSFAALEMDQLGAARQKDLISLQESLVALEGGLAQTKSEAAGKEDLSALQRDLSALQRDLAARERDQLDPARQKDLISLQETLATLETALDQVKLVETTGKAGVCALQGVVKALEVDMKQSILDVAGAKAGVEKVRTTLVEEVAKREREAAVWRKTQKDTVALGNEFQKLKEQLKRCEAEARAAKEEVANVTATLEKEVGKVKTGAAAGQAAQKDIVGFKSKLEALGEELDRAKSTAERAETGVKKVEAELQNKVKELEEGTRAAKADAVADVLRQFKILTLTQRRQSLVEERGALVHYVNDLLDWMNVSPGLWGSVKQHLSLKGAGKKKKLVAAIIVDKQDKLARIDKELEGISKDLSELEPK
ncbi:MAG: hypothetical protein LBD32_00315 [Cytophagales bacterium]|jgi:chromosome segregation ATPase|nr:hypothetical protein [Cytophagales bacterium]